MAISTNSSKLSFPNGKAPYQMNTPLKPKPRPNPLTGRPDTVANGKAPFMRPKPRPVGNMRPKPRPNTGGFVQEPNSNYSLRPMKGRPDISASNFGRDGSRIPAKTAAALKSGRLNKDHWAQAAKITLKYKNKKRANALINKRLKIGG